MTGEIAVAPNPRPMVATWTREQFIQTMRSSVRPNGIKLAGRMRRQNESRMDDDDFAYCTII